MNIGGLLMVRCPCGNTHRFSPSALRLLILYLMDGDIELRNGSGIPYCIADIFDAIPPGESRTKEYRGRIAYIR